MKKPKALLSWRLDVECPKCEEEFDAANKDSENDYFLAKLVFSDDWDFAKADGHEVACPACNHEFEIGGIEY